ncbi:hypothetical protein G4L39_06515 [Limisphaera ngatamarikiensis]|uniref:CRISPR type III-B/RAMP module-associated protein Cmr5 n=1 Tax=Limisphaera ngatamarikiensis TaxID=1324935 RepID=A0A6M1RNB4_9BACT|nr:hypothetical protein [Limisphaera ngatamarikiensis]NGO39049.1 hypothetical protein [Limisphaera ngatamarikiensis]
MDNLDLKCAEYGRRLAEVKTDERQLVDEKVFANALSVLEEQGPYACFLYLQAREGEVGRKITEEATEFLNKTLRAGKNDKKPLDFFEDLALDDLLFARDLLRQVFVYARYHAKARGSVGERE